MILRIYQVFSKTVSRVINGGEKVKEETYRAIQKSLMSCRMFQMHMQKI